MTKRKIIRYRDRVQASRSAGLRQSWGEYQVVDGRKIVGRYDLLKQAVAAHPDAEITENCPHD